jgi:hypothetical protein
MTKDAFEMLTDELTLIRYDIANLQRTSLNKDEAKALNEKLVQGVASMAQTGQAVYEAISEHMDVRLEKLAADTILATTDAARGAVAKSHDQSIFAAKDLAKAAGEARREAWRYFGGFLGVAGLYRRCWGRFGGSGGVLVARAGGCQRVRGASKHFLYRSRRYNRHQPRRA